MKSKSMESIKKDNSKAHFSLMYFFTSNFLNVDISDTLQIFLPPKVQVLPASYFPLYFHCPFDSQQMLVVSHCTLIVHHKVFPILQFLPAILKFLFRKRLQLITCQKYIL